MRTPSAHPTIDAGDPLWSVPLRGSAPAGFTRAHFESMAQSALAGDWTDYFAQARLWGVLSPYPPETTPAVDTPLVEHISKLMNPDRHCLERALEQRHRAGQAATWLHSARQAMAAPVFQRAIDAMLFSSCFGDIALGDSSTALSKELLAAGADPLPCASRAARSGQAELLTLLLGHGVDPQSQAPGDMPLLMEALCKDRCYGSSDKMTCARLLWDCGARFDPLFQEPDGPRCLLDLAIADVVSDWVPKDHRLSQGWWRGFEFPWNYFDEAKFSPHDLLPPESDHEANARIAWISDPARPVPRGDDLQSASGPNPWIQFCLNYPWLGSAFELAALRQVNHAPASARRSAL
jgi:hypothetical protein